MHYYDITHKSTGSLAAHVSAKNLDEALEQVSASYGMSPESFQGTLVAEPETEITYPLLIAKDDYRYVYLLATDYTYDVYDTVARIDGNVHIRKVIDDHAPVSLLLTSNEMDALVEAWQAYKEAHPQTELDDGRPF